MNKCQAITKGGTRCKGVAIDGSAHCYAHHPGHADARRRAARKGGHSGGRGRPQVEVSGLRAQLQELYSSVLSGVVDPAVGAVAAQITNAQIRLIQTARQIRESDELAAQVEELKERFGA